VVIAALVELVDIPSLVALYRVYMRSLGEAYGVAARPDSSRLSLRCSE
jgi:hypothetical protein